MSGKKIILLVSVFVVIFAVAVAGFTAFFISMQTSTPQTQGGSQVSNESDNDTEVSASEKIIGVWRGEEVDIELLEFYDDNNFQLYYENEEGGGTYLEGNYSMSGDSRLRIELDDGRVEGKTGDIDLRSVSSQYTIDINLEEDTLEFLDEVDLAANTVWKRE
ncbi:hypothetical protein [Natranaerofaba carboxydovora]|uniref:hypothetical protein n=1 Tax=Natranaerofaba carboxydovora TaxID=2742683 RepID=UPI001F14106A|nr:hypothetical protein [Natranaerofaba carboxydovora]UMZ72555.1 hypothetical protein ACONDI_00076 [Natranaerofaba carboxydovora]